MKPREPRLNVMIKARLRAGDAWNDALILNMSSRGLLVRSGRRLNPGSYLEIRRGPHLIIARVIWSSADRFGVHTQDPVPAAALIRDPDGKAVRPNPTQAGLTERRTAAPRFEVRHESSRQKGRAMEFLAMGLACGLAAVLIGTIVAEALARPFGMIGTALAAN